MNERDTSWTLAELVPAAFTDRQPDITEHPVRHGRVATGGWPATWPPPMCASLRAGAVLVRLKELDRHPGLTAMHTIGMWANHRLPELVIVGRTDSMREGSRLQRLIEPWCRLGRMPPAGARIPVKNSQRVIRLLPLAQWAVEELTDLGEAYHDRVDGPSWRVTVLQVQRSDANGRFPPDAFAHTHDEGGWALSPGGRLN